MSGWWRCCGGRSRSSGQWSVASVQLGGLWPPFLFWQHPLLAQSAREKWGTRHPALGIKMVTSGGLAGVVLGLSLSLDGGCPGGIRGCSGKRLRIGKPVFTGLVPRACGSGSLAGAAELCSAGRPGAAVPTWVVVAPTLSRSRPRRLQHFFLGGRGGFVPGRRGRRGCRCRKG
jgi:hypothetical protein